MGGGMGGMGGVGGGEDDALVVDVHSAEQPRGALSYQQLCSTRGDGWLASCSCALPEGMAG
eukprot:2394649-Prymnesium_polylepis.1